MASQQSDNLSMIDSGQSGAPCSSSLSTLTQKRDRRSKIWDYNETSRDTRIVNSSGKTIWRCKLCHKEYLESGGTANISSHLIKVHSIDIVSSQAAKVISRQTSIKEAMARGQETSYKRRRLAEDPDTERTIDPAVLEHLYVRWITACGVPFRMVSREEFRALLHYLDPEVDVWLPDSHMSIQAWTLRTYENERLRVQQKVQSALSKVHFTIDLWSSPNSLAILGMIAHYISENEDLTHSVLALKELEGKHSGKDFEMFYSCLTDNRF
jgi:hypothetical protein